MYNNFTGNAQNDLPEFLPFIIDVFHNSLRREVNMTIVGKETTKRIRKCFQMVKHVYQDYSEMGTFFMEYMFPKLNVINLVVSNTRTFL